MENELKSHLRFEVERGGQAYIRNLVAAEQAVRQGKFNTAKILRAAAHSQRVMAMEAARLLDTELYFPDLLNVILEEVATDKDSTANDHLIRATRVRAGLRDIVQRSLTSLENHTDVSENDVAQSLWACYGCGAIMEGNAPHSCPVCGALSVEFEWFGPFFSASAEHLGQLPPEQIIDVLEGVPAEVEALITPVDDAVLRHKPFGDEWCAAEIVGHMLETDKLFAMRARALLEAQGTELPRPKPPWKLHEGKGYETMPAADLMRHLREARADSLDLIRTLTSEDWSRKGTVQGAKTSMLDLGTWLANHDRGHLQQIRWLCED